MNRWMVVWVALAIGSACTPVIRMVQRDGCWVRQTETFPKTIREEIGPCKRAEPKWSNDRVARLVQECVAAADYRWQTEALASWSAGKPLPPPQSEKTIMDACMSHAAPALLTENEGLRKRIAELGAERDLLQSMAQQDREHLRATQERMADALGEAAKKPAPSAIATANSTGTASSQNEDAPAVVRPEPPVAAPVQVQVQAPPRPVVRDSAKNVCTKEDAAKARRSGGKRGDCDPPVDGR